MFSYALTCNTRPRLRPGSAVQVLDDGKSAAQKTRGGGILDSGGLGADSVQVDARISVFFGELDP